MNILVTGVGAIIGYGIINSIKDSKFKDAYIVGMDIYEDAYGQFLCNEFIQSVPAKDDSYIDFVKNIIKNKNIDLVFFGTEQEISKVRDSKIELGEYYSKFVINKENLIDLSNDKWLTYKFLEDNNINRIPTYSYMNFNYLRESLGIPFLLKPKKSYACKGIATINDEMDFNYFTRNNREDFIFQKIIGTDESEYTVSVFGYGDGTCCTPIILKRKLSKAGATDKAWVVDNEKISEQVKLLVEKLQPIGPTNFQFRIENNEVYLLEVNPRISSATSLRKSFGYNEAEMCIDYFLNNKRPTELKIRKGVAIRFIADCVILK